jgi:zinc protease
MLQGSTSRTTDLPQGIIEQIKNSMTMQLAKRIQYERLSNGVDVYMLQTPAKDVVTCKMAFTGGVYATYDKQSVALLLDDLIPGSTKKKKRTVVLEKFEMLGAQMSVHTTSGNLMVTLTSRSAVFLEALRLTIEVLTLPTFAQSEFMEAHARLANSFKHTLENTRVQANVVLMQALFRKGHPHWSPSTATLLKEVSTLTREEVTKFYAETFSAVGAVVCIVGDIHPGKLMEPLREVLQALPSKVSQRVPMLHVDRVQISPAVDLIRTVKNKTSVDTLIGIPVALTRDHHAFQALQVAVSILGGSSSSRFFTTLRTEKNLTYGAFATLGGFSEGYPGYLFGLAIFPNTIFREGRTALKETVQHFVEKGITKTELEERKEELAGKFKVGLSTTGGMCTTLLGTLLDGKSTAYLDTYIENITALTLKEVNEIIKEQLDYTLVKTAGAGAINQEGNPV